MRKALVLVLAVGCTPDILTARQLPEDVRDDAATVAAGNNQFAIDAFAKLGPGNHFFSPFSIATALAMLDAGAAGTTDAELRAALHLSLPGDRAHAAYGAILDSLDAGRAYNGYRLATANRLFGQEGAAFLPDFLERTRSDYGAELQPVDFAGANDAARETMNGWVADHTDGKITELFPSDAVDATTRLALANAIVFAGTWATEFVPSATRELPFTLATGEVIATPMMRKKEDIPTTWIDGATIGVLPYRTGDLSMMIVLPDDPSGLPAIEAQLDATTIARWAHDAARDGERHDVSLPKFTIEESLPLDEILRGVGVEAAFTPGADFSGIDGSRDLFVTKTMHRAIVTVDEAGTTAVAATGGSVGAIDEPLPLIADHPFVFVIFDHVTGSILFMGRLADPR
jgi:serine protease inhibitor